ncbi:MAG: ISL3 family transposase [Gammaproteobacteria bacterium]|nr:ISL3 family transposase [Gammaproteobacteria bacterium]
MSNLKLLSKILRLKGMKITSFWFKNRDRELHLAIKPYKNGCRCPECGRRGRIVRHATELRRWEDLTLMGMKVLFWYAPKEIQCTTHGRVQEMIPWAPPYSRITYRLEWRICALCQIMTQKAAAEILKMAASTLSDLLHRIINRMRDGHKIRGVKTLGVDEISFCKGRKFATLVYDLDRSHILWVGLGKGRETIDRFFNERLSKGQRSRILWASCDMSRAYTEAIKHHCPNATLVIDRFHVVKALNQAVDEVHKDEWRVLDTHGRKAIKGLRWLLSMHSRNRTKGNTRFLNSLRNSNSRIHRAWVLKDEFEHFWNYSYRASAEKFLKRWITAALQSRIPSLRKFVGTLRNHFENILSFVDRNLTNAVGEGLNRIVKIVKNRASGYRNLESFADMIYLTIGDLDVPAQIPSHLRTL